MSNWRSDLDWEKLKAGKFPGWLVKTGLMVSSLLFVGFGALLVGKILRITKGHNNKLAVPFILFVLLFCAVPVAQAFTILKKLKKAPGSGASPTLPPSSNAQVSNTPTGREFFFPAARKPGAGFVLTVFVLFWAAMVWALFYTNAPRFVPVLVSVVGGVIFCACLNLWFRESRVTIDAQGVRAARRWLFFGRTLSFDTAEVARFDSKAALKDCHDIQLITRGETRITIATSVGGKPETDALAREMNQALSRETS